MVKPQLIHTLRYGEVPGLITLTTLTHEAIMEDLERMIRLTIDPSRSHDGVRTGIQSHGPHNQTLLSGRGRGTQWWRECGSHSLWSSRVMERRTNGPTSRPFFRRGSSAHARANIVVTE